MTVTVAVLLATPEVAVIVAVPLAIAVTRPTNARDPIPDETVAFVESDIIHVTAGFTIVLSFASFTVTVSDVVSPNEAKLRLSDDRVTELTT